MAVSLDKSAAFVGVNANQRDALAVVLDWANEAVDRYLDGSTCPAAVVEAATLRLLYYDWHTRYARRPADGGMLDARFRRDAPLSPLRSSGAMSLLSPYKRRSVGTVA